MSRPAEPGPDEPGDPGVSQDGLAEADGTDLTPEERDPPEPRRSGWAASSRFKIACAILGALAVLVVVLAYRSHQERRIVAISVARAKQLVRADTWLGYHEAAALLGVRAAKVDPLDAGALRGFALAMLSLDYRDKGAAADANEALVEPGRAASMSMHAQLAVAAVALGEGRAGTALEYASRAGDDALAQLVYARVAILAGNTGMATEAADRSLAADPELPAALALKGDLLRRTGRSADARQVYTAALGSSSRAIESGLAGSAARPGATAPHARATLGLAKLALSREIPSDVAIGALGRLLDDRAGTPQVERARSAMYLSALQGRAGDRAGAAATLDKAGADGALRAWLEKASGQVEVERGRYRVPDGTPGVLVSASDDDPYVPAPPPPQVEPAPPKQVLHGFKIHSEAKKAKPKRGARAKKAAPKKAARASDR
jgi:tetratricopeptide (TPR) repeat protein